NPLRQNRMLRAPDVAELGLADRLLDPVEFVDDSLAFARELAERPLQRAEADWSDAETVFRRARTGVDDAVHGAAPAPSVALELIAGAQHWTVAEGYAREEEAVGELLPGPQAQASIYAFTLVEQRAKKHPHRPTAEPRRVRKVGIVGAGLMARQLAELFVKRLEVPIAIRDVKQQLVDEAVAELGPSVTGGTGYEGFEGCDLVLEAGFEGVAIKRPGVSGARGGGPGRGSPGADTAGPSLP